MLGYLKRRLSFANTVSVLALFVALGGTSYAAVRVSGAQIVDGSVGSADVRNNDLRSRDILNDSILGRDIRDGVIKGADVADQTLTGRNVDEKTLATVPSAATLGGKGPKDFLAADKLSSSGLVKLDAGQTKTVASKGPFTWKASCADAGGGQVQLTVQAESTEADSYTASFGNPTGAFGPGSPATVFDATSASSAFSIGFPTTAIAPSGAQSYGFGWVALKAGGADCGVAVNLLG